jgi:RNA polymerase sigma-70 factor, ECF subfamily
LCDLFEVQTARRLILFPDAKPTDRVALLIPGGAELFPGINEQADWSCIIGGPVANGPVDEHERMALFEQMVLPHLDAAYNLARWLTGNDHDAQDVAQEASLRAFKFFGSFRGENPRAWLLSIVRNTFYTWLRKNRRPEKMVEIDDETLGIEDPSANVETVNPQFGDAEAVRRAIADLPVEFREIVVLREMEGFSYKEIAELADVPIGTVMSRLARARKLLQKRLATAFNPGEPR